MTKLYLSILLSFLVFCANAQGQLKKYPMPKDVSEKMLASVPEKEGKIVFEEEVPAAPGMKKDELYTRIRKWFADSFAEDKSALETDDVANGLLSGKAAYKYSKASGLIVNSGYINCVIKMVVTDGGCKYQLSDFTTNESTNGLTGLASTGIKHSYDLTDVLQEYRSGKKTNQARRQLDNMNQLAYYIQASLKDLLK
ncbi:MAG: DUF4468 domain-containing protein [Williamsia sp.]|nr:DUF4468 domain-containing protein [Williamsia sp.]